MIVDKAKLKAAAEAATPGPWRYAGKDGYDPMVGAGNSIILWRCNGYFGDGSKAMADANYIAAANPATVLALLAENEALIKERDQLREDRDGLLEAGADLL